MALASRGGRITTELLQPKKQSDNTRDASPERTKIWIESAPKKVPVVYYLCRNGLLQHPHFIQVPLSSPNGLYLKDFINRLNSLRGKGMATMYSWSSKRSYKNGYVWQDLFESDFIYPTDGQEYVLKGSELLEAPRLQEAAAALSVCSTNPGEMPKKLINGPDLAGGSKRLSDLNDYKVYRAESTAEISGMAADASTQTDDQSARGRRSEEEDDDPKTELSRGEISPPPPSSSSPETIESTAKDECRAIDVDEGPRISDRTARNYPSGRIRASAVLRQLISCGSMSGREEQGLSLISTLQRGVPNQAVSKDTERLPSMNCLSGRLMASKDRDCGRLVPDLRQRSSSFSLSRS